MDTGSTAFILICSAMVCLMTPALAFFYGGLGRRKNVINTMMMSVLPLAIASLLWVVAGYSLSFGGQGYFFGNISHLFLHGVSETTSSRGLAITPLAIFIVFWLLLVYYPFAHMVWGDGILVKWGTIDFAGGDVVHITSGVSALVLAIVVGKRRDYGILEHRPHNVPFVLLGASLLWFGWFGFNAGSALAPNGLAVHALVTTHFSAAAAMFSWLALEKYVTGHPTLVGASTGLVAGLVAITPGAGFVSIWSSILIGAMVSPVCFYAISVLKKRTNYDDALDVFGCHGVGGIFGGLCTAVFTTPNLALDKANFGLIYGNARLFVVTVLAIVFTVTWSGLVTYGIIKVIGHYIPLRVSDRDEAIGLDDCEHKETAYPTFMGMDS